MIPELTAATQSVQSLFTLLKTANQLSNYNELVSAVAEVSAKLAAANAGWFASQEKQFSLSEEVRLLKEEIVRLKTFEAERERYVLKDIGFGTLAYAVKESLANGEPPHWLCAHCFGNGKKSILYSEQVSTKNGLAISHNCPSCGTKMISQGFNTQPTYA